MKTHPETLLLLEDNWIISEGICLQLAEFGYSNVLTAISLKEAWAILEEESLDLALLDISLGVGADSLGVAKTLLQRKTPIIFTTGFGIPDDWPPEFRQHPVLMKPLKSAELLRAIETCGIGAGQS